MACRCFGSRIAQSRGLHAAAVCYCAAAFSALSQGYSDDSMLAKNAARLSQMSAEQKEDLSRKRLRFEELSAADKQKLRDLHDSISADPNATELLDTVTRYNRWLATLDSPEKSVLLDIKDPQQRIARIKQLMQQQEERRFKQYFANLPEEDRATIYKWLGEFVSSRAKEIRERLPPPVRQRLDELVDDEPRRREMLFGSWQRWRREFSLPNPGQDEYTQLFARFSAETQRTIESSAASDLTKEPEAERTTQRQQALQRARMDELVRTALYSRFFPQISQEELLKFYAGIKSDDPRRRELDGKEGEELRRELQRMYNYESMRGRGGPSGPPGGRGFGSGWPGGRGGDGRGPRSEDRGPNEGRGAKPPPEERPPAAANPAGDAPG
jgi:hypothetical protein